MNDLISICIPSYNRPTLLVEAVESCFANEYRPLEILIGDDSPNEFSEQAVAEIKAPRGISIQFRRNTPRLGQPANVNSLFQRAKGDRLLLLHDDDRLVANVIDAFIDVWELHPDLLAVFGKQRLINMSGELLPSETKSLNEGYFRTSDRAGLQPSTVTAALLAQFPNNGYMVRTDAARTTGYSDRTFDGDGSDYEFGVRLALNNATAPMYFLDRFTAEYRLTDGAISTVSLGNSHMFEMLSSITVDSVDQGALNFALTRLAPSALQQLSQRGQKRAALGVFFSRYYSGPRWTIRGLFHFVTIVFPILSSVRRKIRNRKMNERRSVCAGH